MDIFLFFFFSSRRRHTRSYGDWSSDVCSSDLKCPAGWVRQANDSLMQRFNYLILVASSVQRGVEGGLSLLCLFVAISLHDFAPELSRHMPKIAAWDSPQHSWSISKRLARIRKLSRRGHVRFSSMSRAMKTG